MAIFSGIGLQWFRFCDSHGSAKIWFCTYLLSVGSVSTILELDTHVILFFIIIIF